VERYLRQADGEHDPSEAMDHVTDRFYEQRNTQNGDRQVHLGTVMYDIEMGGANTQRRREQMGRHLHVCRNPCGIQGKVRPRIATREGHGDEPSRLNAGKQLLSVEKAKYLLWLWVLCFY
jgi:hypothetical protein